VRHSRDERAYASISRTDMSASAAVPSRQPPVVATGAGMDRATATTFIRYQRRRQEEVYLFWASSITTVRHAKRLLIITRFSHAP
jgi:hypothetical protein